MVKRTLIREDENREEIRKLNEELEKLEEFLNGKQLDFCNYYCEFNNGSKAAQQAGYSPKNKKNARIQACNLLKKEEIKKYIEIKTKINNLKKDISREEIIDKLAKIIRQSADNNEILKAAKILLDDDNKNNELLLKFEQQNKDNSQNEYPLVVFKGEDEIEE